MSFRKISDIAKDLKALLVASDKYQSVKIATVTSYEQLLKVIPTLTRTPGAIICVGPGEFGQGMATMQPGLGIVVVDRMIVDLEDQTESVLDALENAIDLIAPGQTEGKPATPLLISGVSYLADNYRPLALANTSQAAYLLEITAHQRR